MATATATIVPSGYADITNLTASSTSNGYTDTTSGDYAQFSLAVSTTGYLYYTFDTSGIPADAQITSVTAKARVRVSSTSRVKSTKCQLFSGSTAKGENATFASNSADNIVTLSTGSSWSRSDLNNLRMKIGGTSSSSTSSKYIRFYGAEVEIEYKVPDVLYVKENGAWTEVETVYRKENGSWVELSDIGEIFDPDTVYVKRLQYNIQKKFSGKWTHAQMAAYTHSVLKENKSI